MRRSSLSERSRPSRSPETINPVSPTPDTLCTNLLVPDKHRGFAFVEFEDELDASDAIDNMDGSELFGRVLRCNHAKAMTKLTPGKAVWNDEEWIKSNLDGGADGAAEGEAVNEVQLLPSREIDEDQ